MGDVLARLGRRGERGQAIIEMTLLLPLVIFFLLVLADFGVALDRREVLQHAVYEGGRKALLGRDIAEVKDYTVAQSQSLLTANDVTVCYSDADGDGFVGNAGDNVRVSADFEYRFSMGAGEILTAFNIAVPTIPMTPHSDNLLTTQVQVSATDVC